MIRVISGENELSALEFQKHYRLPIVHLLDPNCKVEKQYNRDGWPFLLLADQQGKVLLAKTSLLSREMPSLSPMLENVLGETRKTEVVTREGIPYMPATLKRSGETAGTKKRDEFPSLACGLKEQAVVVFTTNRNGNSDVYIRTYDGTAWSDDKPVAASEADEFDPFAMRDDKDRLWLSWTSNAEKGKYNIYVACPEDSSGAVIPKRITDAEDDAMHGRTACDGEGGIWVSYYKWEKIGDVSRDKEVYVRRYDGAKWSEEIRISPTDVSPYEDHSDTAIAGSKHGGAVVAWSWDFHRPRGYPQSAREPTIFIRSIGRDLRLGPIRLVSGMGIDTTPAIAVDAEGYIWCAWDELSRKFLSGVYAKGIYVRRIPESSIEEPTQPQRQGSGLHNVCTPCFAVSPQGNVTLVWSEASNEEGWVLKRVDCEADGEPLESTIVVSEGNPRFPSADYDSKGNLWIAYSAETAGGREIRVRKIPGTP